MQSRISLKQLVAEMEGRTAVNGGSGGSTYESKTYQCHLELYFNDKSIETLASNGLGKSKKEARKVGIRHLVTLLIQSGLIKLGLKDKSFLKAKQAEPEDRDIQFMKDAGNEAKIDPGQEERNKRLKKEVKRLNKRMQEALKDESIIDACQHFCQIICNKAPEWNEVAQIWGFAVSNRDIKFVRIILDLIQYKRVNKEASEDPVPELAEKSELTKDKPDKRAECFDKLKHMYGFGRVRCQNPYDIIVFIHNSGQTWF